MANITDYLVWRGDLTLAERPFNDVDNLVLATLSYLDFTDIVPGVDSHETTTVASACAALLEAAEGDVASVNRSLASVDAAYLEALSASRRFGQATLDGYVDTRDEESRMQFSALRVGLSDGTGYVSFRGTDQTLLGWREDFMLSFEVTGAQVAAARYLDETCEADVRYRVGGHSKGGSLAAYGAIACSDETRSRLLHVYSNDGPSMAADVLPRGARAVLGERFSRIVPEFSIVGMLFERPGDSKTVVRSSATGALAHDPFSWQVLADRFDVADDLLPECKVVNKAFSDWLDGMSLEDRKVFTNDFFDTLEAGGATTLGDVMGSVSGLQRVAQAMGSNNEHSKEVVSRLVQSALSSAADAARESAAKALETARASAAEKAEEARKAALERAAGLVVPPRP